ncbi:uncharacterized protein Ir56a [Drosophila pseudoobscura]|uniref:Uncharacterized protein Ir56a n=1 Tax=Drosophila pseudoobscura pseudoobscura TaxID=46245 RepID=A0A6I8UU64_DROPS|nr:uncharacterized protein LOC4804074 [Drosophila pseudoobscura]
MRILWFCLCLWSGGILLASSQQKWQQHREMSKQSADEDIGTLFEVIYVYAGLFSVRNFITFTGHMDLRPSLQQRLMEKFNTPLYVVGSNLGPLNHHYLKATNIVITLFTGLSDPTLSAVNDTLLSRAGSTFLFFHRPATDEEELQHLTDEEMQIFFTMCYRRQFVRSILIFRRENKYEAWTYYYLSKTMTIQKLTTRDSSFQYILRQRKHRFLVQVTNDMPNVYWLNSTGDSNVPGGGNISIGGTLGILMREFMTYMNSSMDILPSEGRQSSEYQIGDHSDGRIVDVVANLVDDSNLSETSPVLTDSRICLVVPNRVPVPLTNYSLKLVHPSIRMVMALSIICYAAIKYLANPRRSLLGSLLSSLRLGLGIPLPGRAFANLRLSEVYIEVYSLLGMVIFNSVTQSFMATSFTSGFFEPAITNVATMRSSGLRIMTDDPTVPQIFYKNRLPRCLADRLRLVDTDTMIQHFLQLNYSYAYVMRSPNWQVLSLYQQNMKVPKFRMTEKELCTKARLLRLPISTESLLRFAFPQFYVRILESGFLRRWNQMSFHSFRDMMGIKKLPLDTSPFQPLPLAFFKNCFLLYLGGVLSSVLVLIIELLMRPAN